ncbi:MAG: type II toxin-antitoxin system VapC family toxin [Phycisphaerae bacterium]
MPWITTVPVLTEAMHLIGHDFGWRGQRRIWAMTDDGSLEIRSSSAAELRRCRALMEKYRDTPMDIADASLVVLAETTGVHRIFTLDRHFQAYRIDGKRRFAIVPKTVT